MAANTDDAVPPSSSIHADSPETNSCIHGLESQTNVEIIHELRKARARVRFLKNKLRQRGVSNSMKKSSRNQHLFRTPEATHFLRTQVLWSQNSSTFLGGSMGETSSRENIMMRKGDISKPEDLQERENLENEECVQGNIHTEMVTNSESLESKGSMEIGLERDERDSLNKIVNMKTSETIQDLLSYHTSQYNVIAPSSNLKDCKQCILQGPEGRCSKECSSVEDLVTESSTHLQNLKGYLFGQKDDQFSSKRHALMDASDPIYSRSSATALLKHGNELSYLQSGTGYFKSSFGQEFSDGRDVTFPEQGLMESNLTAESVLDEVDLLLHQNTEVDRLECDDLVSKPIDVYEYMRCQNFSLQTFGEQSAETQLCQSSYIQHQYNEADLLDSSYFESKQVMEQQNSAETSSSKLCRSDLLLHHPPSSSMMHSRYAAADFEYEFPIAEHHSVQTSAEGFHGDGSTTREETIMLMKTTPQDARVVLNYHADATTSTS